MPSYNQITWSPDDEKRLNLRMPASMHKRLRVTAALEEMSINEWVLVHLDRVLPEIPDELTVKRDD